MPKHHITRRVPYSPEEVFAIAADVASYHKFLPLLKRSAVTNRKSNADGTEAFDAEMMISYKKLRIQETTLSHVVVDKANRKVTAKSLDPTRSVDTVWEMKPAAGGGTEINFFIDYTLKSKSLQFLLSGMFDMAVRKVMTAFEDRAKELYGPRPAVA